jgi:hypothetical protein
MPHSPARWPSYGLPETSLLLKVDHYMLHVRIQMRSGQYASLRQDADAGEGYQDFRPPVHDERYGLPDTDV